MKARQELAPRTRQAKITKPCETCGADVTRDPWDFRDHVYCSHSCYTSAPVHAERIRARTQAAHPNATVSSECSRCGDRFERPRSRVEGRANVFCSTGCRSEHRRAEGRKFANAGGYIVVGVPQDYPGAKANGKYGQILEHRKVMQDILGRPLLPEENVHHKNGVRSDNRPENLELWTRSQPSGQRVVDKLAWARMILDLYSDVEILD